MTLTSTTAYKVAVKFRHCGSRRVQELQSSLGTTDHVRPVFLNKRSSVMLCTLTLVLIKTGHACFTQKNLHL